MAARDGGAAWRRRRRLRSWWRNEQQSIAAALAVAAHHIAQQSTTPRSQNRAIVSLAGWQNTTLQECVLVRNAEDIVCSLGVADGSATGGIPEYLPLRREGRR